MVSKSSYVEDNIGHTCYEFGAFVKAKKSTEIMSVFFTIKANVNTYVTYID